MFLDEIIENVLIVLLLEAQILRDDDDKVSLELLMMKIYQISNKRHDLLWKTYQKCVTHFSNGGKGLENIYESS